MLKTLIVLLLLTSAVFVARAETRVELPAYDQGKAEIVRKLRLHRDHLMTLEGSEKFKTYRKQYVKRSEAIIRHIQTKKVSFYLMDNKNAIMEVRGIFRWLPRKGIYVSKAYVKDFQQDSNFCQGTIAHELSHLLFWTDDEDKNLEDYDSLQLPNQAGWYDLVILFSGDQKYLEKFYLTDSKK